MKKHKGFPSRQIGTDFQFTVRRENKAGATLIFRRERYNDRKPSDRRADESFIEAVWNFFGESDFERGNLDAGRISWLFERELVPVSDPFDPQSYKSLLKLNINLAQQTFPEVFKGCLLYTSPSPRDKRQSRMPCSA